MTQIDDYEWLFRRAPAMAKQPLAVGVALIVLPGPALIVIPVGLAILSIEFAWARLWLQRVRRKISSQAAGSRADRAEHHRDRVS